MFDRIVLERDLVDCRGEVLGRRGLVVSRQTVAEAAARAPVLPRRRLEESPLRGDVAAALHEPLQASLFASTSVRASVQRALLAVELPDALFEELNAIYVDNVRLEDIAYAGPPPPPPPTVPFTVLDWNMDDKPLWWGSGGWNWSQNSYRPVGTYSYGTNMAGTEGYVNTNGLGGSSGWVFWMTNTDLAAPNTPQGAGIGMNGGGPITGGLFTSANLADYVFSFACRAEGLAGANAGAMAAVVLNAPDDTIQPPDADPGEDRLIGLNFNLPATANWQTLVFKLKEGGVDSEDGSSMSGVMACLFPAPLLLAPTMKASCWLTSFRSHIIPVCKSLDLSTRSLPRTRYLREDCASWAI